MRYLTTLLITSSLWLANAATAQNPNIMATAYQTINVRSGPGAQFEIVGQLTQGDSVPVNGRDDEKARWLQVALEDEILGWVAVFSVTLDGDAEDLPVIEPGAPNNSDEADVKVVAYGRVNVRSGPNISYEVIGQLDVDEEAPVYVRSNENNDWLYIELADLKGWVAFFTVTVLGDTATLPIRVPDGGGIQLVPPSTLVPSLFNVYLRTAPTLSSSITGIVLFDSATSPVARTEDSLWIYVVFDEIEGWGMTELFDISETQLAALPVYALRPFATRPPVTPASTTEVTQEPVTDGN